MSTEKFLQRELKKIDSLAAGKQILSVSNSAGSGIFIARGSVELCRGS